MDGLFYFMLVLTLISLIGIQMVCENLRVRFRDNFSDIDTYDELNSISEKLAIIVLLVIVLLFVCGVLELVHWVHRAGFHRWTSMVAAP